jgi:hypothetical protein
MSPQNRSCPSFLLLPLFLIVFEQEQVKNDQKKRRFFTKKKDTSVKRQMVKSSQKKRVTKNAKGKKSIVFRSFGERGIRTLGTNRARTTD